MKKKKSEKVSTIVDKRIYWRIKHIRESIDNGLIKQLKDKGIDDTSILFEYEDEPKGPCCPKMKVTAYATYIEIKRTKDVLDDHSDRDAE